MFILIFTRTDNTVTRAIGDYVDAAEVRQGGRDYFCDGLSSSYITEETEAVFVPVLHRGERVLKDAADGHDEVVLVEAGADERAAHVPCAAEDLGIVSEVSFFYLEAIVPFVDG